jgi:hypothetical protein
VVPRDRRVDRATARQRALANRLIDAPDPAALDCAREDLLGAQSPRNDEQSTRILVEPVHESCARHRRERRIEIQQRVLQGPRGVARARMDHEAGRLVDDEERGIRMDDGKDDGLWLDGDRGLYARIEHELLTALEPCFRRHGRAPDRELPPLDPLL